MKKRFAIMISVVLVLSALVGCTSGASGEGSSAPDGSAVAAPSSAAPSPTPQTTPEKVFTLRFSSASTPDAAHSKAMYKIKEVVEASTNGQIIVDVYLNSTLFAQDAEMEAIMSGDLDMAYATAQNMSAYVPELSMFTKAYAYKDYAHMEKVLHGEIGRDLFQQISDTTGLFPLSAYYTGARHLNLRLDNPVNTPADLSGIILRMPNSPDWLFMGEALGAKPTPLAFGEVYTALQTGTIDAQENPLPTDLTSKFYEVTKQISLTGHVIDTVWPAINRDKWDEMGPELQAKLMEAINEGRKLCDETNLQLEKDCISTFESEGLVIVQPDLDAFIKYADEIYLSNERSNDWDMDLYRKIQDLA